MVKLIAQWNSKMQLWEKEPTDLFSEQSEPWSGTWPTSGMTVGGKLSPLPVSEPRISGNVSSLLPTPQVSDRNGAQPRVGGIRESGACRQINLNTLAAHGRLDGALLPTPTVADAGGGHATRSGARNGERLLPGVARAAQDGTLATEALLSTPQARDSKGAPKDGYCEASLPRDAIEIAESFGKYEAAVRRWESITRKAPEPTVPGVRGRMLPRLNPQFSEWMMGWPAGWATDVELSRKDVLAIIGNGVVPQQAYVALSELIEPLAELLAA